MCPGDCNNTVMISTQIHHFLIKSTFFFFTKQSKHKEGQQQQNNHYNNTNFFLLAILFPMVSISGGQTQLILKINVIYRGMKITLKTINLDFLRIIV